MFKQVDFVNVRSLLKSGGVNSRFTIGKGLKKDGRPTVHKETSY